MENLHLVSRRLFRLKIERHLSKFCLLEATEHRETNGNFFVTIIEKRSSQLTREDLQLLNPTICINSCATVVSKLQLKFTRNN